MKFIKKIIEQLAIYCKYDEEEQAVEQLKKRGFIDIDFYHMEEEVKVTGKKTFQVEKGAVK